MLQVSTPRKRPALLATGGAQAMAEVAEELLGKESPTF